MGVIALPELPWRKILRRSAPSLFCTSLSSRFCSTRRSCTGCFRPALRETILYLQPLPKPKAETIVQGQQRKPVARRIVPVLKPQNGSGITLPQTTDETPKALRDPGMSNSSIAVPANLPKLTEEQRAACAKSAVGPKQSDDDSVDFADHSDRVQGLRAGRGKSSARTARRSCPAPAPNPSLRP